jgi:hypothetical protein
MYLYPKQNHDYQQSQFYVYMEVVLKIDKIFIISFYENIL